MTTKTKPPVWFWIVSVLTLLWNVSGIHGYLSQAYKTNSYLEAYTAEQIEIMNTLPAWYTALFAIAVFSGTVGCILLLLKKRVSAHVLLLSFVAALVMMVYFLFIADLKGVDFSQNKIFSYFIIAVAAFLVWFSRKSVSRGWLN